MDILNIVVIGVGLSMDAFAVSIAQTLCGRTKNKNHAVQLVLTFALFQGLMPVLGWIIGVQFEQYITAIDHWIAFILLAFIGGKMLKEAFSEEEEVACALDFKTILVLAIATSIDALAVGVSFAFLKIDIILSSLIIAAITCVICSSAVLLGNKLNSNMQKKSEIFGGIILIGIGLKILIEHLFF